MLSGCREPKRLYSQGVVDRTQEASVAPVATICLKATWRMNDWGDPVSNRARHLNRDITETPLESDSNLVNVAFSIIATPPIKEPV